MIYSLFQLLLYFAMATLNWIIFKTRFDKKKKSLIFWCLDKKEQTQIVSIAQPSIHPR